MLQPDFQYLFVIPLNYLRNIRVHYKLFTINSILIPYFSFYKVDFVGSENKV